MRAHPSSSPNAPATRAAAVPRDASAPDRSLHLRGDGLSFAFPDRPVLTDVSLVVPAGTPTGLLGENGSGKSTLLRLLAGELVPDRGELRVPGPVGLLRQDLPFPASTTVHELVEDALARSRRLERELIAAGEALAATGTAESGADASAAAREYDRLLLEATLADVWDADHRADAVLAGLGLEALPAERPLGALSGGQRERLALAHLLIARPTTWLLDEPTNHLDDEAAAFLTAAIAAHPGPVLLASHDRAFLDEATAAQLDLDPAESPLTRPDGGLTAYTGGFSDYLLARFDARDRWEHRYRDEQEELRRLREVARDAHTLGRESQVRAEVRMARKYFADRNAVRVSRHVRDAEQRLARLEAEQVRKPPAELHLTHLPAAVGRARGGELVAAHAVEVAGRLGPTDLRLGAGERLLVTGPNGSGKSTLLDLVVGDLAPTSGTLSRPRGLRIGHLAQDDEPVPGRSVGEHLRRAARLEDPDAVPELFGLVHPRDLPRPLTALSRGQLRRVLLAAVLLDPPELLVLDEPTNHLALVTATRLESALEDWDGTVLIASHDRWLRRRWQGEVLELGT
ncbi:ABC-F family ATP-binding cassette domain-containing protein [Brachybacterium sp. J153]|uniref:ABC-F family ATP-binding cassette domain-containing protein n=1 Tax=Brachybacterium sp. J153 TaxID=3116488 RepID=UPI002E77B1C3|nr:ABC-F family ATP-binding cassette domain-containing protein [Brachybacterium sp. J153]MEE1618057.1 ABC-F family ATP-binding cassette domain-containing protein [Brachybacterium sp. J153]